MPWPVFVYLWRHESYQAPQLSDRMSDYISSSATRKGRKREKEGKTILLKNTKSSIIRLYPLHIDYTVPLKRGWGGVCLPQGAPSFCVSVFLPPPSACLGSCLPFPLPDHAASRAVQAATVRPGWEAARGSARQCVPRRRAWPVLPVSLARGIHREQCAPRHLAARWQLQELVLELEVVLDQRRS